MNVTDLLKLAHAESPATMEKVALAHALVSRLDPFAGAELSREFSEILEHTTEKTKTSNAVLNWAKDVGGSGASKGVETVVGGVVAGLGLAVATDLYQAARKGLSKERNWKRTIEADPSLKSRDIKTVRRGFDILHRHAPDVAADPMYASAFLHNYASFNPGEVDPTRIGEAVRMQKEILDAKRSPFQGGKK